MAELKSAYELAMERLRAKDGDEMPLSEAQREAIAEVRNEYRAKLAEREIMLKARVERLAERTPPGEVGARRQELEVEHAAERKKLEDEMDARIGRIREEPR